MISLLLPTRRRQHFVKDFVDSIISTAHDIGSLELIVRVDFDDDSTGSLIEITERLPKTRFIVNERPVFLGDCWNDAWKASTGDILQLCTDDLIYKTKGWDKIIHNTAADYPDGIFFICGMNGRGRKDSEKDFATHPFIGRKLTEVLGYFVPHGQKISNDSWQHFVCSRVGRKIVLNDVLIEHRDPHIEDDTHKELYEDWVRDGKNYESRILERLQDVVKVRRYLDEQKLSEGGIPMT